VAIEGIDGSGKGTQANLLRDALTRDGLSCGLIAFPRYEATTFGRTIARYLNGEFGDLATAGPHFAALLYAGDRFESLPLIHRELQTRDVLIFDRYVPSNIAHQAAKLPAAERESFIAWVESIEYGVYSLPRPDRVIFLDIPVEAAQQLIARKPQRRYTAKAADLHEADAEYLKQTADVYRHVAARDPAWHVVSCCDAGNLRSQDALGREICEFVRSEARCRRDESTK
jgi:dTMP kinase